MMTIYDVAKRAGVSIATVSRVINGSDLVTEKTRIKVEGVMNEIGYRPNIFARGLVTDTVKTIGAVSVDIRDSYYSESVYEINNEMRRMGYGVVITNCSAADRDLKRELGFMLDRRVDGIILVGSVFSDEAYLDVIKCVAESVPVMMINAKVSAENVYCTVCDDEGGTYSLMEEIHKSGRKKPLYVYDVYSGSTREKIKGYKKAVKSFFNCEEEVAVMEDAECDNIIEKVKKDGFDCVVFSNDFLAAEFAVKAKNCGICVPSQVGIAGYNDLRFAKITSPALSTVNGRASEVAKEGCCRLIAAIEGGRIQKIKVLEPTVVIRESF